MADPKEGAEESFKVFDRRKFTLAGEERTDLPPEERKAPPKPDLPKAPVRDQEPPKKQTEQKSAATAPGSSDKPPAGPDSEEFSALLMSLANTAVVYLESKDPIAGRSHQNAAAAKQMIDWISILQRKTEGNRTPEESHLLENLLYELRMQFLAKNKPPKL